jgi:aminoglycoside phosphotransferase (APT) family kinase protein
VSDLLGTYLEKIAAVFPKTTWDQAELVTHGWSHDVVIFDERLVFRFPKTEGARAAFPREVRLMQYLAPRLTVAVPSYSYVSPDVSFAGYDFISGVPVSEDDPLPETGLGDFLSELHAIPTDAARRFDVDDVAPRGAAYLEAARVAQVEMTDLGISRLEKRIALFLDELEQAGEHEIPVLLHRDLVPPHILSDGRGTITGVIDFDGVRIGDPALDFQNVWGWGPKAVAGVCRTYRGPKDDDLVRRSLYYKALSALSTWYANYRRGMSEDFLHHGERELGRWLQKEPDEWIGEVLDE